MLSKPYLSMSVSNATPRRAIFSSFSPLNFPKSERSVSAFFFASIFSDSALSISANTSDKSTVSTLMCFLWNAISSTRTVLNAVVRAPIAPTVKCFNPFTARQTPPNRRRSSASAALSGCAANCLVSVYGMPAWRSTLHIAILPHTASLRCAKSILPISSGYACMRMGTPASFSA